MVDDASPGTGRPDAMGDTTLLAAAELARRTVWCSIAARCPVYRDAAADA
jgi:hypothetical protein